MFKERIFYEDGSPGSPDNPWGYFKASPRVLTARIAWNVSTNAFHNFFLGKTGLATLAKLPIEVQCRLLKMQSDSNIFCYHFALSSNDPYIVYVIESSFELVDGTYLAVGWCQRAHHFRLVCMIGEDGATCKQFESSILNSWKTATFWNICTLSCYGFFISEYATAKKGADEIVQKWKGTLFLCALKFMWYQR